MKSAIATVCGLLLMASAGAAPPPCDEAPVVVEQLNVRDFFCSADGTDWAPAFRRAVAVATCNGGKGTDILIPAGEYPMQSVDPTDPLAESHVYVSDGSVTFRGMGLAETSWPFPPIGTSNGAQLYSETSDLSVFKVSRDQVCESWPQSGGSTTFERIRIGRTKEPSPTTRAAGILIAPGPTAVAARGGASQQLPAVHDWIWDIQVVECGLDAHNYGVLAVCDSNGCARPTRMQLIGSEFQRNYKSGAEFGIYHELSVDRSNFLDNAQSGLKLIEPFSTYEAPMPKGGTVKITGCSVFHNGKHGIEIVGMSSNQTAIDIHMTGTQIDYNLQEGLAVSFARNVNVSGCSFTANGACGTPIDRLPVLTPPSPPVTGRKSGAIVWMSDAVSFSGCNFQFNGAAGLYLHGSNGVSLGGCTFSANNNNIPSSSGCDTTAAFSALLIIGGDGIAGSGLSFQWYPGSLAFQPGKYQTHAIWLGGLSGAGPKNVNLGSISFDSRTPAATAVLRASGSSPLPNASGVVQYVLPGASTLTTLPVGP